MNFFFKVCHGFGRAVVLLGFLVCVEWSLAQPAASGAVTNEIRIVELQGTAEVASGTAGTWTPAHNNQILHPSDRLRIGPNSRVALLWADRSVVSFGAMTEIEVLPPDSADAECGLHLFRGILSFFHRGKPGRIRVITRGAVAGVEGTEFVMAEDNTERTTLSVIDGKVRFANGQATLMLTNGEQAVAAPGQAPVRTAGFIANNLLQWCFYYPAVIDPADLKFTPEEQNVLGKSLQAYRSGDLLAALAHYPAGRKPGSDDERVYYAGLLLSVGQVQPAESLLPSLSASTPSSRPQRIAAALRRLIAAVKRQPSPPALHPKLATEFLADSYYEQSRAVPSVSLKAALNSARQAATKSPDFSFAWERVAELEFSFGRTHRALVALNKSLALAPRNAQALALKGFLLAAQNRVGRIGFHAGFTDTNIFLLAVQNRPGKAISWFNRAIAVDSALGNAWLGRGLCRIRIGDLKGGQEDLLVAAAMEPQRAELRDYLGKAYTDAGNDTLATKELERAKELDPNDPTAWLYSALLNQQENRINDAIRDLEKSQKLNDNRSVYRSQLLLDQDRAVRSANLAAMYQDDGMDNWAVDEASRAVNYDYANYSAHLFLANSYASLIDPNEVNLRYETPAESEYLVANLLSPVSAGTLSPEISQQEYSPLFERNGFGVVSSTEYLSRGAWTQSGAQFGIFGNFAYDVGAIYRTDPGQYANNDIEQRQLSGTFKYQFTPKDTAYLQVKQYEGNYGDLSQHYDPYSSTTGVNPTYRAKEDQTPIVGLGYHHEWSPGVHTVFYAARLVGSLSVTNSFWPAYVAVKPFGPSGQITAVDGDTSEGQLNSDLTIYSAELQQIWQTPKHNTIIGTRFQYGNFDAQSMQYSLHNLPFLFPSNGVQQAFSPMFRRFSVYGYHQWQILEPLQLIGGVTYDRITYPENFLTVPASANTKDENQISPKAGLIFTPFDNTTLRFAYTRSLAGVSFDQDFQLEPSQVAGFIQSYRSLIPESVAGSVPGAKFETYGISLEQKFPTETYLSVSGKILNSTADQTVGAFDYYYLGTPPLTPSGLNQHLDYTEQTLLFTANQLLGKDWALGARYRVSDVVLNKNFPGVPNAPASGTSPSIWRMHSVLNQVDLVVDYNHPSGFFARGEAHWYHQHNSGYNPPEPGDDFWQLNAYVGYRFLHRKGQVTLGLLNITGPNYHLDPLNYYNELPRSRTLFASLQFNF